MPHRTSRTPTVNRSLKRVHSAASLALAALYTFSPLLAAAAGKPAATPARNVDAAALLLGRFSFGARPGDLARVRSMGAYAWFEQQLQPDRVDDSELEQRLNAYPAMRMSQANQIARYPTPSMVRNAAKTGYLPADPELHAIMADQVEFYQMRQQVKAEKPSATASSTVFAASQPRPHTVPKGLAPLDSAPAEPGGAMTGTASRLQRAGGGTGAAAAAQGQAAMAPPNLEQATDPLTPDQESALLAMPPQARYERLLHMSPAELIAARKGVRGDGARLADSMTPLQKETLSALAGTNRMISGELFSTRLLRDIYSDRQLQAVMTDFWLNHFNIYIRKKRQHAVAAAGIRRHGPGTRPWSL